MLTRNNSNPFIRLNIIDKSSLLTSNNRQKQEHLCIFDCQFIIPFDEPLLEPSNCREQVTSNACEVYIRMDFSLNSTYFVFLNETLNLTIDNIRLDTVSAEILGFEFDDRALYCIIQYQCSNGNKCEWNYIIENIPRLIVTNYLPLYDSLSRLIYNENPETMASHCYSSDELTECSSGICDFSQFLDPENFTLISTRQCLMSDTPKIYFGRYRYTPGPMKYDFDYLYFVCNINECNSPENELAIKSLIGFNDNTNLGLIKTGYLYPVFSMYFIISLLIKNCLI
ncbi:unnamed protein product [Rotaria sp. Silwood2]|nr:unnamed protein product [Rotaria sp. Silwood2]CAF3476626.1 unnamed protein product [Rotaria sp. Silwood2]CAF4463770.1 unnamed protein product [Rotaria sp. Silwood2]CAF4675097.1 unnamed protein product [Rotaria sp. Silwood2]